MLVLAVAAALAGCGGGGSAGSPPTVSGPVETGLPPSIGEPATTSPVRATATPPPVSRDGDCPYFSRDFAMQTVGQHLARSTVTSTQPYPGCTLYRPDGGRAIDIRVTEFPTALAAGQRAVVLLGSGANPVDVGDHAVVAVRPDGTKLAASKGRYVLQVFINQQSSLEARDIADAVASKIH